MAEDLCSVEIGKVREILTGYGDQKLTAMVRLPAASVTFYPEDRTADVTFRNSQAAHAFLGLEQVRRPAKDFLAALKS